MEFLIIIIALFVIELLYFRIADQFNIIDKPNERSSHTQITLRGGGIIFYFAVAIYFVMSGFQFPYFFLGLTLVSLVSFLDDIMTLSNKLRIFVQLTSVLLMFYDTGFFSWPLYLLPIAMILAVGTINAYNFMDGINGITVSNSLAVLGLLALVNHTIPFIDANFICISMLSCLVFGFFNFRNKAKCFAGDVGSVAMAFIILFLIGKLIFTTDNLIYILFLLVYGVDSVLTIVRRIFRKENIFEAHRSHLYQILANEGKKNRLLISFMYGVLQVVLGLVIIELTKLGGTQQILGGIGLCLVVGALYTILKTYLLKKYKIS